MLGFQTRHFCHSQLWIPIWVFRNQHSKVLLIVPASQDSQKHQKVHQKRGLFEVISVCQHPIEAEETWSCREIKMLDQRHRQERHWGLWLPSISANCYERWNNKECQGEERNNLHRVSAYYMDLAIINLSSSLGCLLGQKLSYSNWAQFVTMWLPFSVLQFASVKCSSWLWLLIGQKKLCSLSVD